MNAVAEAPDQKTIRVMFDRIASRYDIFNRLTSFGMDGLWRNRALSVVKPGMRILDLGCGTGDLTLGAAERLRGSGEVVGLDFSENMLAVARQRAENRGLDVRFEQRRAEEIPFEKEPYDAVLSGFVLRNIYENIDAILSGVHESLKSGGEICFLDFTEPQGKIRKKLWQWYMAGAATLYGRLLFGKDFPAPYLTESAARFLKAPEFAAALERAGFREVRVEKFMMGSIVLYKAKKP